VVYDHRYVAPMKHLTFMMPILYYQGILAMGAMNSFIGANFILGQANLVNLAYEIQRWHTVLVAYSITLFAMFINMWGPKLWDNISKGTLIFNIVSFVVTVVTILACNNNKQSASFVFRDFQNFTGFSSSIAGIIDILQPAFVMCCCKNLFTLIPNSNVAADNSS
jgi:amino acid transporter